MRGLENGVDPLGLKPPRGIVPDPLGLNPPRGIRPPFEGASGVELGPNPTNPANRPVVGGVGIYIGSETPSSTVVSDSRWEWQVDCPWSHRVSGGLSFFKGNLSEFE
jgi:hypothetical protein